MTELPENKINLDMLKQENGDRSEVPQQRSEYTGGSSMRIKREPHDVHDDEKFSIDEENSLEAKQHYRSLKKKIKALLYEQECFYEELRRLQRKLLRINRDKSFLLDRLLQYELPEFSSSDDEETASSSADEVDKSYFKSESIPALPTKQVKKTVPTTGKSSSGKSEPAPKAPAKSKRTIENVERVRCKQIDNGKRCPKMVSKRVKSGLCLIHRQPAAAENEKKQSTGSVQDRRGPPLQRPTPPKQPRIGSINLSPMISGGFINDDLRVSDERDMQQDMFDIGDNITSTGPADSPASPDFHSNIYDGDDDLVIDLPE